MLVSSILSSSHNVVYPENAGAALTLSLANGFKAKILSFVKGKKITNNHIKFCSVYRISWFQGIESESRFTENVLHVEINHVLYRVQ